VKSFLNLLRKPAPATIMATDLDNARRSLIEAQDARDYANAMVLYHETRIDRLRASLELESQAGAEQ
jgi:hypothetical protein